MSFQYIFNNAETINITCRPVVAQTITRAGAVRAVSRGGEIWRFEVKLPDGPRWSDIRQTVAVIESLDRYTTQNIQINNSGYNSWLINSPSGRTTTTAAWTQGSKTITSVGHSLKKGDYIQLPSNGRVYQLTTDVSSGTAMINRPIYEATGSGTVQVGPNCVWRVFMTEFPTWTIFARDQVQWNGSFVFTEVIT